MLKVYLVQMESRPGKKPENLAKAREMVLQARPAPNSLVLLPEMFATGYNPAQALLWKESCSGNAPATTSSFLQQLSNETNCIIMGGGISEGANGITNHVGIHTPGSSAESAGYDKIHPFFPELELFSAGQDVTLFKIFGFTVSPTICFDLRFPELYREATARGAQLFTVHASWPAKRSAHWEALLKARAIENQAYVAAVNCVTSDGKYSGDSQIIDPLGNVVVKAEPEKECVVSADVDIDFLDKCREDFPVLPKGSRESL
jgi:predicted amidohydrolase